MDLHQGNQSLPNIYRYIDAAHDIFHQICHSNRYWYPWNVPSSLILKKLSLLMMPKIFPKSIRSRWGIQNNPNGINVVGTGKSRRSSAYFLLIMLSRCSLRQSRIVFAIFFTTEGSTEELLKSKHLLSLLSLTDKHFRFPRYTCKCKQHKLQGLQEAFPPSDRKARRCILELAFSVKINNNNRWHNNLIESTAS